jgi:hypothetical protein
MVFEIWLFQACTTRIQCLHIWADLSRITDSNLSFCRRLINILVRLKAAALTIRVAFACMGRVIALIPSCGLESNADVIVVQLYRVQPSWVVTSRGKAQLAARLIRETLVALWLYRLMHRHRSATLAMHMQMHGSWTHLSPQMPVDTRRQSSQSYL